MRTSFLAALAAVCLLPVAARAADTLFDADWRFIAGDPSDARQPLFDDSAWTALDLPHDWSIAGPIAKENPTGSPGGFFPAGIGWYRKTFTAPGDWVGHRVQIRFDGVYMLSDVWLNGQNLGTHPCGYTPFSYDLTDVLKPGEPNTLSVRVDNSKQINSRWYSGSGIYRHVWLETRDLVNLETPWVRTISATDTTAVLKMALGAENHGSMQNPDVEYTTRIFALDASGKPSGEPVVTAGPVKSRFEIRPGTRHGVSTAEADIYIPQPALWSPDHPHRYLAITSLSQNGREVDRLATPFGIRTIEVPAQQGFLLNGQRVPLYGGCVHHDNGALGAAAFDRAEERRVQLLKEAGFNAVRTSHNPPSPAFLEACDRLGLMVIDEAFDCWELGKNREDYQRYFKEWWRRDLDAMVLRDRNHPSVVMWSVGNEIPDFGSPQGLRDGTALVDRVRELDPTRPVTAAINWWPRIGGKEHDWKWTDADALMGKLDVAGYNYQIPRYAADHQRVPTRVVASTESYPRDFFECWAAAEDHPWIVGDFVWTAMDYLGESGIGRVWQPGEKILFHAEPGQFPYHGAYCGDIDLTGFCKPVSHARAITWDRGEKLYTAVTEPGPGGKPLRVTDWGVAPSRASWTWPGQEGKPLEVQVYSRCDRVRLYLNDQLMGEKPTTRGERFRAVFSVPYAAGTLRTVGLDGAKEVATNELKAAGPVAALRLTADRTTLAADGQDLSFITVESIDAAGNFQPNGDALVSFDLTGPAKIAGVANADFANTEGYQGPRRKLYQGRALVIVRGTHQPGAIELRATAEKLPEARQTLHAR